MNGVPTFTVLLPAKGRPDLVRDALLSVLEQSYNDFEIIISNNGADPAVRNAVSDRLNDPRIRYLEQPEVLAMPEHWEHLSRLAVGRFLTVLPDRSVLKKQALAAIAHQHQVGGDSAAIVTWGWDLYYNQSRLLLPFERPANAAKVLESSALALDSMKVQAPYPFALPRGLNSSVSREVIAKVRARNGAIFSPINPDFSFAYDCLMCHDKVTHLGKALMISQGLSVSNGGNAYRTDATNYVRTLGLANPIRHSPIKEMFVQNVIAEDFFAACHRFERHDILAEFDPADLYIKCFLELSEKRSAALLTPQRIGELALSLEISLENETGPVKTRVNAYRTQTSFMTDTRRLLKKLLGANSTRLQHLTLRLRGGKRYSTALVASGHRSV